MIPGPIVPLMCWRRLLRNAYKEGILCESKSESDKERECVQESGEKESCKCSKRVDELSRVDVILLLYMYFCILSLISNNINSLPWM